MNYEQIRAMIIQHEDICLIHEHNEAGYKDKKQSREELIAYVLSLQEHNEELLEALKAVIGSVDSGQCAMLKPIAERVREAITLHKRKVLREGWAEGAKAIADAHDDRLLLDFDNEADADVEVNSKTK